MAVCSIQTLIDADPCLVQLQSFDLLVLETQLLCNLLDKLANAGEVTCDIQTLLTQGKCFYQLQPHVLQAIKIQLLCEISQIITP